MRVSYWRDGCVPLNRRALGFGHSLAGRRRRRHHLLMSDFCKDVFRKRQQNRSGRSQLRSYLLFLFILQFLVGFPKLFGQSGDFGLNRSELERESAAIMKQTPSDSPSPSVHKPASLPCTWLGLTWRVLTAVWCFAAQSILSILSFSSLKGWSKKANCKALKCSSTSFWTIWERNQAKEMNNLHNLLDTAEAEGAPRCQTFSSLGWAPAFAVIFSSSLASNSSFCILGLFRSLLVSAPSSSSSPFPSDKVRFSPGTALLSFWTTRNDNRDQGVTLSATAGSPLPSPARHPHAPSQAFSFTVDFVLYCVLEDQRQVWVTGILTQVKDEHRRSGGAGSILPASDGGVDDGRQGFVVGQTSVFWLLVPPFTDFSSVFDSFVNVFLKSCFLLSSLPASPSFVAFSCFISTQGTRDGKDWEKFEVAAFVDFLSLVLFVGSFPAGASVSVSIGSERSVGADNRWPKPLLESFPNSTAESFVAVGPA